MPRSQTKLAGVPALLIVTLMVIGFAGAVAARVAIGRPDVAYSSYAGIAFAACLLILMCIRPPKVRFDKQSLLLGMGGAIVLCIPSIISRLAGAQAHTPYGNYWYWALVVGIVALAEEAFLRGTLFTAVKEWKGDWLAVALTSLAFALLHVPLYGWHVVPLDVAVGVCLGALRLISGSFVAPAITHILADWAGWWLR